MEKPKKLKQMLDLVVVEGSKPGCIVCDHSFTDDTRMCVCLCICALVKPMSANDVHAYGDDDDGLAVL